MDPSALAAKTAFEKLFRRMAPERHRYEVFRDFVTLSACALHNGFWKEPKREAEYLAIIAQYKPADQKVFPELFAHLVAMLEPEPRDMLGPLYMEMEVASRDQGQFFTPPEISEMMARIQGVDKLLADERPFITLSEPACGAGGMVLEPMARKIVPTGLRVAIPDGFEMQIRPRSGLALKHGISVPNTPGTIDSDYRGPLGVLLINYGAEPFLISHGDRIAQAIIAPVLQAEFAVVDALSDTDRGAGGFGSTGRG